MLVDTHAHLHFDGYAGRVGEILANAKSSGVTKIMTVGVDATDSAKAVEFASKHGNVWATVGLHPHDASRGQAALDKVAELATKPKVVAIGECGLDYYRKLSTLEEQEKALRFQIELAKKHDLPLVFHVRDAFDRFFQIIDDYDLVRGVIHSFTSNRANMEKAVDRGLFIALNGIMTFTKDEFQLEAAKYLPLDRLLLETDCPFLTPAPLRGKENQPANLKLTAEFLAELRGEQFQALASQTTQNAVELFGLK